MNEKLSKAWQQYEAGKAYKRRIGLYETVRKNEAFYRGEQWQSGEGEGLPKPVVQFVGLDAEHTVENVTVDGVYRDGVRLEKDEIEWNTNEFVSNIQFI